MIDIHTVDRVSGLYRVQVLDAAGDEKSDTGWFSNLITDFGLDLLGDCSNTGSGYYNQGDLNVVGRCAVGTGNTPPAFTDTALASPLAMYPVSTSPGYANTSFTYSYVAGPPVYYSATAVFSFPLGGVVGNIAEVGTGLIKISSDTTPYLFSRALIVDSMGTPTTISVTSADQLVVTFQARYYMDTTDTPYSTTISGTTYTGDIRRANITSATGRYILSQVDRNTLAQNYIISCTGYNGTIGSISSAPSGSSTIIPFASASTYVSGDLFKSYSFSSTTAQNNLAGGLSALRIVTQQGEWQMSVSPAIPKDNTKIMTLNFNVSWARYP